MSERFEMNRRGELESGYTKPKKPYEPGPEQRQREAMSDALGGLQGFNGKEIRTPPAEEEDFDTGDASELIY